MKRVVLYIMVMVAACLGLSAQEFATHPPQAKGLRLSSELLGSSYSGASAAFWSVHGQGGRRSLTSTTGLLDITASYRQPLRHGQELYGVVEGLLETGLKPKYRVRQLGIAYRNQWGGVKIGAMDYEQPISFSPQTSGAMVLSNNALPIPMVLLHTNKFLEVPGTRGLLSLYADFSLGRFFETKYNELTYPDAPKRHYTLGTLWHHKTGYIRVGREDAVIPLTLTFGGTHAAQWGGHHYGMERAEPATIKDMIRVVMGKSGGSDATISDQINVLGNHFGQYLFELAWYAPKSTWQLYHLHVFEDKSGIELNNGPDGVWGFHLTLKERSLPVSHAVVEYLTTLDQSGPFHILDFYRPNGEGRGGGADGYYSNGEYMSGATYVGMNIGNPLLLPRDYKPYLDQESSRHRHNRVETLHIGISGTIQPLYQLRYEAKLTFVKSWGSFYTRAAKPFRSTYSYLRVQAPIGQIRGLYVGVEGGWDVGSYTSDTAGGGLSIQYHFDTK